MIKVNRKVFFDGVRNWLGPVNQQQANGLTFLLDSMEKDPFLSRITWAAYMLATTKHETAHTFQPIHEYGGRQYFIQHYGGQTRKGHQLGNDTPEEGADYAGRGDVQLTGETNYEKAEKALREEYPEIISEFEARTGKTFDLTRGDQEGDAHDPDNAMDPGIAYAIMSYGMRTGMFTGLAIGHYLNDEQKDYINARRVINGKDQAGEIAGYAQRFENILRASLMAANGMSVKIDAPPAPSWDDVARTTPLPEENPPEDSQLDNTPLPESPAPAQNAETIINNAPATGGILAKVDGLGDRFQSFQGVLAKFGFSDPNAQTSPGTILITVFKLLFGAIMAGLGVALDHWQYIAIAALAIGLGALLWDRSRGRVAAAKEGMPKEVAQAIAASKQ